MGHSLEKCSIPRSTRRIKRIKSIEGKNDFKGRLSQSVDKLAAETLNKHACFIKTKVSENEEQC